MASSETDAKLPGPAGKKARTRSPAYPYLDLRAALEKAAVLWRTEGRHAVVVSLAMQHWGYKAESSTGYSCVAALKKFGLVDEEGTGENRQMRLSRLALAVLLDDDRASPERNSALRTAALSPRIHAELWEKYGPDLPSDGSLRRFLILEKNFNEAAVEEFLEEYKSTVAFAGLRGTEDAPSPQSLPAAAGGVAPSPRATPGRQRSLPPTPGAHAAATSARSAGNSDDRFPASPKPSPGKGGNTAPTPANGPTRKKEAQAGIVTLRAGNRLSFPRGKRL